MKRRTSSVLPVFYSHIRQVATAPKQNPRPDSESTISPPPPNLSKWSRPQPPSVNPSGKPTAQSISPSPQAKTPQETPLPQRKTSSSSQHDQSQPRIDPGPSNTPQTAQHKNLKLPRNPWGKWARPNDPTQNNSQPPQEPPSHQAPHQQPPHQQASHQQTPRQQPPRQQPPRQQPPHQQASHQQTLQQTLHQEVLREQPPHQQPRHQRAQHLRPTKKRDVAPRKAPRLVPTSQETISTRSPRGKGLSNHRQPETNVKQTEIGAKPEEKETYADYIPPVEHEVAQSDRKHSWDKTNFKTRGSIAAHFRGHEADSSPYLKLPVDIRTRLKEGDEKEKRRKAILTRQGQVLPDVFIPSTVSVGQLARLLNVRLKQLQKKMAAAGMTEESAFDHILTSDYAALLVGEFNRNPVINDEAAFDIYPRPAHPDPSKLPLRPPIVTIMGHVDHGKTTLLDTLRSASVAKGEAGGITQHIGAFSVPVPVPEGSTEEQPRTITFLDTPGHAAFSAMRARGAGVTDIIVLVVAADDGVMPQTKEVIELAKKDEENVGVVVAINKVDKPSANVDNVTQALMTEGIQLESYGGDTPGVEVSGLTGQGLDTLVETISVMAEMQDLRAERDGQVHGYVLESNIRKGLGPVATVLIVRGCLTTASHVIAGTCHGKVRVMTDSAGASVKAAYPGMAVAVSGWRELPNAGDEVLTGSEADVKKAFANRQRKAEVDASLVDMEAINTQRMEERRKEEDKEEGATDEVQADEYRPKELRLVIKGDVSGSVEAIEGALQGIGNKDVIVKIVSTGVGDVSESDVMMAQTAEGMIIAFSVNTPRAVQNIAASNNVTIYTSAIIYRIMEEVRNRVVALLPPIIETQVTGEANVLELFSINLKGRQTKQVAGCRVINGLVEKSKKARVIRNGVTVHEGSLETLKQSKRDVLEIRKGMECGMSFTDFEDLRQDDLIQTYLEIVKPGTL